MLPDGLKLFDRLTGLQLITYAGLLRGMARDLATARATELIAALGLAEAQGKLVVDYSAGMTKKATLACALVHAPRVLVLDEPFEAVDPISAATIRRILEDYVAAGGTVVLSSHVMDLVQRTVQSRRRHRRRAGARRRAPSTTCAAAAPSRSASSSSSAAAPRWRASSWLRTSSD